MLMRRRLDGAFVGFGIAARVLQGLPACFEKEPVLRIVSSASEA